MLIHHKICLIISMYVLTDFKLSTTIAVSREKVYIKAKGLLDLGDNYLGTFMKKIRLLFQGLACDFPSKV